MYDDTPFLTREVIPVPHDAHHVRARLHGGDPGGGGVGTWSADACGGSMSKRALAWRHVPSRVR